ncbi:Metallo-hydrolase/oxidoreductase [Mycena belliarum]|uniref:Metallo-hydrolase/oxidoreductase n=1 Tax=Mycena belliarum TaxID=1033014 RepID=A0AAD6UN72_9AGAR|nr:Metallo-hydrolase/oxidoreductase [Mycena belliae]
MPCLWRLNLYYIQLTTAVWDPMSPDLFWILAGALSAAVCFIWYSRLVQRDISLVGRAKPKAAFRATRLTASTFLISEYQDIYGERPQIFVKLVPSARTILIVDTGCGGVTADPTVEITSLRQYIEEVKLDCNGGAPLNEAKNMEYVVVATHCHYDHILGMEQFHSKSQILVSSYSPSFISASNLPTNSLCASLGIETPSYSPVLVPHHHAIYSDEHISLGVSILHTPGHTPDELALFDYAEKMLYVGDSLYEKEPIIFPKEGSIVEWLTSIEYLILFVAKENETGHVRINSGHATVYRPALEVLVAAKEFMQDVIAGREPVRERITVRGEENVVYLQDGGRFALRSPERLVLAAQIMSGVQ